MWVIPPQKNAPEIDDVPKEARLTLLGCALGRTEGAVLLEDRHGYAGELALLTLDFADVDADDFALLGLGFNPRHHEPRGFGENHTARHPRGAGRES